VSLTDARATIAAAMNGVPDVRGYAFRSATPRPGDSWPLLGALEHGPGNEFVATWRVIVFLPQTEATASEWIDSHWEEIFTALETNVGFVERIEPVNIGASGTDQLALQLTLRSEA